MGLAVGACGLQLTGVTESSNDGGPPPSSTATANTGASSSSGADDGAASTTDPPPPVTDAATKPTTFACGKDNCTIGSQVCCDTGVTHTLSCQPDIPQNARCNDRTDAGTPDAGGTKLSCTSYTSCPNQWCCYDRTSGASCRSQCLVGQQRLCTLNLDGCGMQQCRTFNDSPANTIGSCQ